MKREKFSLIDIIKSATPEQKIIWNWLFETFGENISIKPIYFIGSVIGTQFDTYNDRILYFCLDFETTGTGADVAEQYVVFNDYLDAVCFFGWNDMSYHTSGGIDRFVNNNYATKNIVFSRVLPQLPSFGYCKIVGFQIGI